MKIVIIVMIILSVLVNLVGCGLKPATELPAEPEEPAIRLPIEESSEEPDEEPPPQAEPQSAGESPAAPRYVLTLSVTAGGENEDAALTGTAEIAFTNTSAEAWEKLCLRDYMAANLEEANHMMDPPAYTPGSIRAVRDGQGNDLSFTADEDPSVVWVELPEPLEPGAAMTIAVDYETAIPAGGTRLCWFPAGDFSEGAKEAYGAKQVICLSQAYPVLAAYLEDGWNTAPYFTDGECFFSPCGNVTMELTLPEGYTAVSTGSEEQADGVWHLSAENVRDFGVIASNVYEVVTTQYQGVAINSWYYAGADNDRQQGEISLQAALDAVAAFSEAWGVCPYDELDVVETPYNYGGMEYPGMVRISDSMAYRLDEEEALRLDVAHETAHQWFYAAVGNDQYREAWLDESFAAYGELVYLASLGAPEDELAAKVAEKEGTLVEQYINLPYGEYGDYTGYVQAVYKTGCVFLWELREAMGQEAFDLFLRIWYEEHEFEEVTTKEFREAAEAASGGSETVTALLDQYLK